LEWPIDWIVEQGDLIYIPAQIAHWGTSIGESMTYSIGFRSPSHSELLLECTHCFEAQLEEDDRYRDGDELLQNQDSGRIPPEAVSRLKNTLAELVDNTQAIEEWLGEYASQLKTDCAPELLPLDFASVEQWQNDQTISLSPFNRSVYITRAETALCFINGEPYALTMKTAKRISNYCAFRKSDVSESDSRMIERLLTEQRVFIQNDQAD
jgi:50S ribosomal protein L16 3-hydroxylase